jgi:hypothetical protein
MKGEVMLNSLLNSIVDTIFLEVLLISVMISATMAGCAAQTPAPSIENTATPEIEEIIIDGPPEPPAGYERDGIEELGIKKIASDGSSLYYYENGERISLTPSLDWMTIKFSTDDLTVQNDALQKIDSLANIEQKSQLADTEIIVLPLLSGLSIDSLISNINLLRTNTDVYSQVNPVFIIDGVEKAITDKFVAAFSTEKSLEDIHTINSAFGVTIDSVEDQNSNSYVLLIPPTSQYDSMMMANMYYEEGYAVEAMPLFVSIGE